RPGLHLRLRGCRGQISARAARRHVTPPIPVQRNHIRQVRTRLLGSAGVLGLRESLRHARRGLARPDRPALSEHGVGATEPRHHRGAGRLQIGAGAARPRSRDHLAAGCRSGGGAMPSSRTSSWDRTRAVADAVLYEGYLLYPYRGTSSKNQSRWQFGVLGPPGAADAGLGEDDTLAAQFPVEAAQAITLVIRFLQLQHRRAERELAGGGFEPVRQLSTASGSWLTWDEAVEGEMSFGP